VKASLICIRLHLLNRTSAQWNRRPWQHKGPCESVSHHRTGRTRARDIRKHTRTHLRVRRRRRRNLGRRCGGGGGGGSSGGGGGGLEEPLLGRGAVGRPHVNLPRDALSRYVSLSPSAATPTPRALMATHRSPYFPSTAPPALAPHNRTGASKLVLAPTTSSTSPLSSLTCTAPRITPRCDACSLLRRGKAHERRSRLQKRNRGGRCVLSVKRGARSTQEQLKLLFAYQLLSIGLVLPLPVPRHQTLIRHHVKMEHA
jgi:hypothetical protein